jgi:rubredoxin
MVPTRRKLVWVQRQNFQGWACTECAWVFNPSGPLVGKSIDEMKMRFEQQRDKEFTSHVCADHPRATKKSPLAK